MTFRTQRSSVSLGQRISIGAALLVLSALALTGCKSKQDQALDAAKQAAISTGVPQQVTTTDKNGNTTVSIVRPPAPGQKDPIVTTTTGGTAPADSTQTAPMPANGDAMAAGAPAGPAPANAQQQPVETSTVKPLDVHIPAGTNLPIRINQTINVKTAMAGDRFTGALAESIRGEDNQIIVPRGTHVAGVVSEAHRRGHFKGASILSLRLTSMQFNGQDYPLSTGHFTEGKRGKGRRTAALIGGGAGVGMLIGGIASGGVGLLAGGLAGGGAGTLLAGTTGNRDIVIPAETIVRFRLSEGLSVEPLQQ